MGGAVAGIGEALRSTRERRGLSIDQVAQDTRISPRFLEALEAEQFHELPAPVYVRGFLRSYANYLRIEPQPLLDQLIGGDMAAPGSAEGYVGGNGRSRGSGMASPRRNDPFQRSGVVAAPRAAGRTEAALARKPDDDDGWAPEPLAPFTPPHEDHGYIPGSDLLEAPEYPAVAEVEPVYRRRTAGVLAERPPAPGEPGVPRKALVFGGAVVAVLAFLGLAVLATRDSGNGSNSADATGDDGPGATPGTVISLGGASGTATAAAAGASATPTRASATASTTPDGTTTPGVTTTTVAGATTPGTSTPTPTPTTAAPTQAPTATPTLAPPTPTPTVYVPPPHPSTISACDLGKETEKCGSANVRVICYPPFAETDPTGRNNNYFVDVTGAYPLQPGWRETIVFAPVSLGPVIDAGRSGCI
jgi:hypothetical protein